MSRAIQIRSAIAGALFALGLAGLILTVFAMLAHHRAAGDCLQIEATGQKRAASHATEVWLVNIRLDNKLQVPLDTVAPQDGWRRAETNGSPALVAAPNGSEATLDFCAADRAAEVVRLGFLTHEWSGIVRLRWHGREQEMDLFKPGRNDVRLVFLSQVGGRIDLSTVQVQLLALASAIVMAAALRWLRTLLARPGSTAHPAPS